MWTVSAIFEDDYGCEERLPGERLKCIVELTDDLGEKRVVKAYEEYLTWNKIDVGSTWHDTDEADRQLFFSQKKTLDTFLSTGALTKDRYEFSLNGLIVKMGFDFDILNESQKR